MKGSPTNQFLARQTVAASEYMKREGRTQLAKWLHLTSHRLLLLDCNLRNEKARQEFLDAIRNEQAMKL